MTTPLTELGYLGFEVSNLARWEAFASDVLGFGVLPAHHEAMVIEGVLAEFAAFLALFATALLAVGCAEAPFSIHTQDNDLQTAETNFLRAVNADPGNLQAIFNLAALFYRKGNLYEARKYLSDFHAQRDSVAESLWLAVRIEHKLGDKVAEAGFAGQLRRRFAGTPEHQLLMQGKYD